MPEQPRKATHVPYSRRVLWLGGGDLHQKIWLWFWPKSRLKIHILSYRSSTMYVGCAYSGRTVQVHLGVCSENCWVVNSLVHGGWCRCRCRAGFVAHRRDVLIAASDVFRDGCEFESTIQVRSHLWSVRSPFRP